MPPSDATSAPANVRAAYAKGAESHGMSKSRNKNSHHRPELFKPTPALQTYTTCRSMPGLKCPSYKIRRSRCRLDRQRRCQAPNNFSLDPVRNWNAPTRQPLEQRQVELPACERDPWISSKILATKVGVAVGRSAKSGIIMVSVPFNRRRPGERHD